MKNAFIVIGIYSTSAIITLVSLYFLFDKIKYIFSSNSGGSWDK